MKKQYFIGLLVAGLLAACAASTIHAQNGPKEQWTSYIDAPLALKKLPEGRTGMVFVRENTVDGLPLNIFINKEYFTSILPGAYQQAVVCPRPSQEVSLSYISVEKRPQNKAAKGQSYATPLGQNAIFLVTKDPAGKPVLTQIGESEFKTLLPNLKQQNNILSRVDETRLCTAAQ